MKTTLVIGVGNGVAFFASPFFNGDMRRAARIDSNQPAIVKAVRQMGCSVQHIHQIGSGCPDLIIGVSGINLLWEIKDSEKPKSARRLTPDEITFFDNWRGQVQIIESVEQAIRTINFYRSIMKDKNIVDIINHVS